MFAEKSASCPWLLRLKPHAKWVPPRLNLNLCHVQTETRRCLSSQHLWKGSCSPPPLVSTLSQFLWPTEGTREGSRERAITGTGIRPSLVESLAKTSAPEYLEIVAARSMEQSSNGDAICSVHPAEASGKLHQGCPSPLNQGARSHRREAGLKPLWTFPHSIHIYSGLWWKDHQRG